MAHVPTKQPSLPSEGFVRLKQILQVLPIGKTVWWEGVKSGRFPAPIKLGPRTTAWRVEDIRELIDSLYASNAPNASTLCKPTSEQ